MLVPRFGESKEIVAKLFSYFFEMFHLGAVPSFPCHDADAIVNSLIAHMEVRLDREHQSLAAGTSLRSARVVPGVRHRPAMRVVKRDAGVIRYHATQRADVVVVFLDRAWNHESFFSICSTKVSGTFSIALAMISRLLSSWS